MKSNLYMYKRFNLTNPEVWKEAYDLLKVGTLIRTNLNNGGAYTGQENIRDGYITELNRSHEFHAIMNTLDDQFKGWHINLKVEEGYEHEAYIEIDLDRIYMINSKEIRSLQTWPEGSYPIKFGI